VPVKNGCVTDAEAAKHRTWTRPVLAGVPELAGELPEPEVVGKLGSATTLVAT